MRILKPALIALILCSIVIPSLSCGEKTEAIPEDQVVTVQRGDLTVDITAAGNLALSSTAEPAFQVAGYVEKVFVEEGDTVEAGQVLASLDTTSLERAVRTAEQAAKTAEIDLEQASNGYYELIVPYPYTTYKFLLPEAVDAINIALVRLKEALEEYQEWLLDEQYSPVEVKVKVSEALELLTQARAKLALGFGGGVLPPSAGYWALRAAQLAVDKAQLALDKANDALDVAKDELEKAVVVAPFAGFVTKVNVEGGDEVYKGTVVAQVADPDRFEAELMVNEMDIFQLELGGGATVQIDALPTLTLPAKVTHISPTATITSGVVNYAVEVELEPLQAVQEGQEVPPTPTMLSENFQLREGLSVTVSILVAQRTGVLLVPNAAITTQLGQSYVQVMLPIGTTEQRAIKTGISNWQYTEVTDGLSEGEAVIVPQGTTTTPTTSQEQGGPPPMFFPP